MCTAYRIVLVLTVQEVYSMHQFSAEAAISRTLMLLMLQQYKMLLTAVYVQASVYRVCVSCTNDYLA
jgi:ABC-type transporter Mla maintaining outer membrane lipid asymmetry permease subunit MlaE